MRVFSQYPDLRALLPRLLELARVNRGPVVEVLAQEPLGDPGPPCRVRFRVAAQGAEAVELDVVVGAPTDRDREDARRAEEVGRAAGMAALAARCPALFTIREGADPLPLLELTALLCAVSLGPALPDGEPTLYGVRGARQRAEALRAERG